MNGFQLSQGYRTTTRRQFSFYQYFPVVPVPGTHFIDLERVKAESTLKPPSCFELEAPGMGIQRLNLYTIAYKQGKHNQRYLYL